MYTSITVIGKKSSFNGGQLQSPLGEKLPSPEPQNFLSFFRQFSFIFKNETFYSGNFNI